MLEGDSFLLPITALQTLIKRAGGGGDGEPISLSSTSMGSLIFPSSPLSADVGSAGVAGDSGDGNGDGNGDGDGDSDGDGDGDGTSINFCLFFATFTFFAFLFTFFLGGCKIAGAGAD